MQIVEWAMFQSSSRPHPFSLIVLFFGSAIVSLGPAKADVVLPASWATGGVANLALGDTVQVLSGVVVPGETLIPGVPPFATSFAKINVGLTPVPNITATASGYDPTALTTGSAFAQGYFTYYGSVDAPGGAVNPTTVNFSANGSIFSMAGVTSFGSNSFAQLRVNGLLQINKVSDQGNNNSSFSITSTVPVNTNQTFAIEMFVRSWTFEPNVSATTFLDPFFFLDPIQIDQGYTLRFSENVGNSLPSSEVPIPAALPLFATGLAGLGLLGWRRRQKTAAAL